MEDVELAREFERHRARLRAIAHRVLGSQAEADDAVQETWLRLSRIDTATIENLGGWLTTVVSRVCLNVLRARDARREDLVDQIPDPVVAAVDDPQVEVELADGVGIALLVVLETLSPSERVSFVLHDLSRQGAREGDVALVGDGRGDHRPVRRDRCASRPHAPGGTSARQPRPPPRPGRHGARRRRPETGDRRRVPRAAREGDFGRLLVLLDPDVVRRADLGPGVVNIARGAERVAAQARTIRSRYGSRPAPRARQRAPGIVTFRNGRPFSVMAFEIADDRIVAIDILADRERLAALELRAVA
jgi:RNA polymerase sigma-70 factor, ECF subfamily